MFETFHKLPESYQGYIALFVGSLLLLHVLGFAIAGIHLLISIFALYLLAAGFLKSGLYKALTDTINRMQEKK
jgi:hypothetical protein